MRTFLCHLMCDGRLRLARLYPSMRLPKRTSHRFLLLLLRLLGLHRRRLRSLLCSSQRLFFFLRQVLVRFLLRTNR